MKNHILTIIFVVILALGLISIPVLITANQYEIVKLDKISSNSSDLLTGNGIHDPYINNISITIIDDCDNVYINDKNISIEYGNVYAVKYARHLSFGGERYIKEAYKTNATPINVKCQGKPINDIDFYANI